MEGLFTEITVGSGVFFIGLALIVLVFGGVLLARLASEELRGKRFSWAEWPESESEAPEELDEMRVA